MGPNAASWCLGYAAEKQAGEWAQPSGVVVLGDVVA